MKPTRWACGSGHDDAFTANLTVGRKGLAMFSQKETSNNLDGQRAKAPASMSATSLGGPNPLVLARRDYADADHLSPKYGGDGKATQCNGTDHQCIRGNGPAAAAWGKGAAIIGSDAFRRSPPIPIDSLSRTRCIDRINFRKAPGEPR